MADKKATTTEPETTETVKIELGGNVGEAVSFWTKSMNIAKSVAMTAAGVVVGIGAIEGTKLLINKINGEATADSMGELPW